MSKLQKVRDALNANSQIEVVRAIERNYMPGREGYWSHTMRIIVAPKVAIYDADKLQEFMLALVPGLEPTSVDRFWDFGHCLDFGKLYFDEDIGTENVRHDIVLTDPEMVATMRYENGRTVIEESLAIRRRTWVYLYPSVEIAIAVYQGPRQYRMPKEMLAQYQERDKPKGLLARVLSSVS